MSTRLGKLFVYRRGNGYVCIFLCIFVVLCVCVCVPFFSSFFLSSLRAANRRLIFSSSPSPPLLFFSSGQPQAYAPPWTFNPPESVRVLKQTPNLRRSNRQRSIDRHHQDNGLRRFHRSNRRGIRRLRASDIHVSDFRLRRRRGVLVPQRRAIDGGVYVSLSNGERGRW